MNTVCQRMHCRTTGLLCLAALALVGARADEPKQRLLAEFVPPSILAPPRVLTNSLSAPLTNQPVNAGTAAPLLQAPAHQLSDGERWERFETEFGISEPSPLLVKGSLESAKYQLDKTVFVLNEFVKNVEDKLSFDYSLCSAGSPADSSESSRTGSGPVNLLWDAVENAHLKSDIDLDPARGRAFAGVQLVLPLGD